MAGRNNNWNNWWKKTFGRMYFSLWDVSSLELKSWTKKEFKLIEGLPLKKNAKVLDIPCGQGYLSVELAKKGFQITGVDYSLSALNIAKEWAAKNKVSPVFIKQDIRFLKIKEKFDAILTLGNSFGYFTGAENEKVIENISRLLKPNGFFVLHQANPIKLLREFGNNNSLKINGGCINLEDITFDPLSFTKKSRWVIVRDGKREILNVRLRLYIFPEISSLLSSHKLKIIRVYGSFDKKPYQFNSPAMIVVARKVK